MASTDLSDLAGALEDVSQRRNPEREALWASTNADARKVLSYRGEWQEVMQGTQQRNNVH
jgi:hypothetical protein